MLLTTAPGGCFFMNTQQIEFFQQYLLFPSVVALLASVISGIASYKATYKLNKSTKEEEQKIKLLNLVDKLLIEVNRLIPLFEKLRTDFDKDNFYSFRNIELISSARWRLVNLNNDVILFNDDLRTQILEDTDTISILVDELKALEDNPMQGYAELKNKLDDAIKNDRAFRLELLSMGIYLGSDNQGNLVPQYIGKKVNKNKTSKLDDRLQTVEEMRQTLISGVLEAQKQLDSTNADVARKRDRLVARIIDAQNRFKELQKTLNSLISSPEKQTEVSSYESNNANSD